MDLAKPYSTNRTQSPPAAGEDLLFDTFHITGICSQSKETRVKVKLQ